MKSIKIEEVEENAYYFVYESTGIKACTIAKATKQAIKYAWIFVSDPKHNNSTTPVPIKDGTINLNEMNSRTQLFKMSKLEVLMHVVAENI
jgi:hypothetical protein